MFKSARNVFHYQMESIYKNSGRTIYKEKKNIWKKKTKINKIYTNDQVIERCTFEHKLKHTEYVRDENNNSLDMFKELVHKSKWLLPIRNSNNVAGLATTQGRKKE